jgi:preprotein translocase subunit SecG
MAGLTVFLYVLVVIASVLLIGLILLQPAKSGGMGAAFGGVGESVFGGKAGSHLTKTTVIMTTVFFVVALALAAFIGRGWGSGKSSEIDTALSAEVQKAAAADVKAAPAANNADKK